MAMTIKGRMAEIWRDQPCVMPCCTMTWGDELPSDSAFDFYFQGRRRNILLEVLEGPSLLSVGSKLVIKCPS